MNINQELSRYYEFKTYTRFINEIEKTNLTDDEIRSKYSHVLFLFDEIHSLNSSISEAEEDDENFEESNKRRRKEIERVYNGIFRVCHIVQGSKFISATATPMTNDVSEFVPIVNLFLPMDRQLILPVDPNLGVPYTQVTLAQMEPYLRGKISYVRELETGAIVRYQGVLMGNYKTDAGNLVQSQMKIYTSTMSEFQTKVYNDHIKATQPFYRTQRQAACFAFPDGSVGVAGFNRYVYLAGTDDYRMTNELRDYLDNYGLYTLSSKFNEIVNLCKRPGENCWVYTSFKKGAGAFLLGLCLEYSGFTKYTENSSIFGDTTGQTVPICPSTNQDKTIRKSRIPISDGKGVPYRYALLTSETSTTRRMSIMEAFNSYENRHGDIIKVVIGSPVTQAGISFANILQIHLVDPSWNASSIYQALSRAVRATSHNDLLEEEKKRTRLPFPKLYIETYLHAAKPLVIPPEYIPVDFKLYQIIETKDRPIKRMERIMKQVAIDCPLHRNRNIRVTDIQGSAACDYSTCEYQCSTDIKSEPVDTSTYDVFYSQSVVTRIILEIQEIFKDIFTMTLEDLYKRLNYRPRMIDLAIQRIILDKTAFTDRYGFSSYLCQNKGLIFLQKEYPLTNQCFGRLMATYSEILIANKVITTEKYIRETFMKDQEDVQSAINEIYETSPDEYERLDLLRIEFRRLNEVNRANELEAAISSFFIEGQDTMRIRDIIQINCFFFFNVVEPVDELTEDDIKIKKKGRKMASARVKSKKINSAVLTKVSRAESARKGKEKDPGGGPDLDPCGVGGKSFFERGLDRVFLHTLYTQKTELTSYKTTSNFVRVDTSTRILNPSEKTGWRDLNVNEVPIYSEIIQTEIAKKLAPFEQHTIYGTLLWDGIFRIRDKSGEEQSADTRKFHRGIKCTILEPYQLYELMFTMNVPPPDNAVMPSALQNEHTDVLIEQLSKSNFYDNDILNKEERSASIEYVVNNLGKEREVVNALHDKELIYYILLKDNKVSKSWMCEELESKFREEGRLLIV